MAEVSIKVNASTPIAVSNAKNKFQKLANLTEKQQQMIFELVDNTKALDKLIANKSTLMRFL